MLWRITEVDDMFFPLKVYNLLGNPDIEKTYNKFKLISAIKLRVCNRNNQEEKIYFHSGGGI